MLLLFYQKTLFSLKRVKTVALYIVCYAVTCMVYVILITSLLNIHDMKGEQSCL